MTPQATGSETESNVHEWVIDRIRERTDPENPTGEPSADGNVWTGRVRLVDDGEKFSTPHGPDAIDSAIDDLVGDGRVVYWHGLIALAEPDTLRAVATNEARCPFTRKILLGRVNQRLTEVSADG